MATKESLKKREGTQVWARTAVATSPEQACKRREDKKQFKRPWATNKKMETALPHKALTQLSVAFLPCSLTALAAVSLSRNWLLTDSTFSQAKKLEK